MGSLFAIMLVFVLTAVLVKVPLEPLPFFAITMVKIIIINCESSSSNYPVIPLICTAVVGNCCLLVADLRVRVCTGSLWGGAAGQPVWNGRRAARLLHHAHHERPGDGWILRRLRHDLRHRKSDSQLDKNSCVEC